MDWIEVSVSTTTQAADTVSGVLISCGARGTQILDRLDVPDRDDGTGFGELYGEELKLALPEDVAVKAWFASGEEVKAASQAIAALGALPGLDCGSLAFSVTQVQDEDWAENWKKYYKPQRVGKRLVIRPVWEEYEERPGDLVISMDPGMAFGTGTHETTRLCMEMIERHFKSGLALDIGTGSGILAIALARLGAGEVMAVDIDPIAVKAAGENVARNGLSGTVTV
ncbi:MAG TPA: 50S ribosomal protein L11 methyltransferase, partial [Clostridia bacterium]|nr:50S ribosomal protein L11 methyltransferase [Clostridia bacterium]